MKRFVLFLVPALLMIFTGCSDHSSSASSAENQNIDPQSTADEQSSQTNKDEVKRDSTSVEKPTHHNSTNTDNNTDNQNAKTDSGKTTDTSNIHISSGTTAIEYLKRQLEMDNNDDIAFNDIGGALKTDKTGSYYTIKLISKSIRENGGSGTVGIYKVYQDGTYTSEN